MISDYTPEFRAIPLMEEAREFTDKTFPVIEHPMARPIEQRDDDTIAFDITQIVTNEARAASLAIIGRLTDETLAIWLTSRGWTVQPPFSQPVNYNGESGNPAAQAPPEQEEKP